MKKQLAFQLRQTHGFKPLAARQQVILAMLESPRFGAVAAPCQSAVRVGMALERLVCALGFAHAYPSLLIGRLTAWLEDFCGPSF